jgi:2-polyprenyl-3-methyl-5-hydroxy-6-metoxy-1,4-benzoquinol methylase
MDDQTLAQSLSRYPFYHIIALNDRVSTPGSPDHVRSQQPVLKAISRLDVTGKRVLDIGCRDGLYSFAVERMGAAEVIGIDNDISKGAVEVVIPYLRSSVRMHQMNLMELVPGLFGKFDVIIFAGVLYHLRYPFWALKLLGDVMQPGGKMILETAIFYSSSKHSMLYCPVGKDSPYEATSCTFFNKKGLVDTLTSLGWRVHSTSLLHPHAENQDGPDKNPVIDRAVFVCEFVGCDADSNVEKYWHSGHDLHSQYGGDVARVKASGALQARSAV